MLGGAVVFKSIGFPLSIYLHRITSAIHLKDVMGGLLKSFVFGIIIASIGCYEGLGTKAGSSAVGVSTTRAVVRGIILIIIADGIFSLLYYFLGI